MSWQGLSRGGREACPNCNGSGETESISLGAASDKDMLALIERGSTKCTVCHGTGKIPVTESCSACGGLGSRVPVRRLRHEALQQEGAVRALCQEAAGSYSGPGLRQQRPRGRRYLSGKGLGAAQTIASISELLASRLAPCSDVRLDFAAGPEAGHAAATLDIHGDPAHVVMHRRPDWDRIGSGINSGHFAERGNDGIAFCEIPLLDVSAHRGTRDGLPCDDARPRARRCRGGQARRRAGPP